MVVLIWGNFLLLRGFKIFIKERQQCRGDHKQKVATLAQTSKSVEQEFALQGYDKASPLTDLCTCRCYHGRFLILINKEEPFKNVLIPQLKAQFRFFEDYKDHLGWSLRKEIFEDTLWVIKKRSRNSWTFYTAIGYVAQTSE